MARIVPLEKREDGQKLLIGKEEKRISGGLWMRVGEIVVDTGEGYLGNGEFILDGWWNSGVV